MRLTGEGALLSLMLLLCAIFLAGTFFLTAISSALRRIPKKEAKERLQSLGYRFFYRPFHLYFFPHHEFEGIFFASLLALNITRFFYAAAAMGFLLQTSLFQHVEWNWSWLWLLLSALGFLIFGFIVGDYLPRLLGTRFPEATLRICTFFASFFLYLAFPFTYIFLKISQTVPRLVYLEPSVGPLGKREIMNMLESAELGPSFDIHDKRLIESVVTYKERIAREVMVPRVDLFSLPHDMTIKEAARISEEEGYSRIPIYRNTVDNIVGVLMYKDILAKYLQYAQSKDISMLEAPISSIQKPVLHVPETKKIANLLQEFRKKQVHMAIVVDEYGGTSGIVTIEDILEEIVGDISDEYDEEEALFYAQSDGSWVVDARMNILDVEEELGINIPQEGEYDTIGGYVFHTTGMIPPKGFVIHHDEFEMEILRANDRSVERVRLKPILKQTSEA